MDRFGVHWDATKGQWVGRAYVDGGAHDAGVYTTVEQAAGAARALRLKFVFDRGGSE
jgi:hypothetical protein